MTVRVSLYCVLDLSGKSILNFVIIYEKKTVKKKGKSEDGKIFPCKQ
jgi:hypothetical protein